MIHQICFAYLLEVNIFDVQVRCFASAVMASTPEGGGVRATGGRGVVRTCTPTQIRILKRCQLIFLAWGVLHTGVVATLRNTTSSVHE